MRKFDRIQVRCDDKEKKELIHQASLLGYENYSDYIRALVFDFDTVAFKKERLKCNN